MSDFEFPDLPSDEELGITDEDRDAYDKEFGNEAPDTSDAEVAELLGDTPSSTNKRGEAESTPSSKPAEQASKSAARDAKKAAKAARAEERRTERKEKKEARARAKAGAKAAATGGAATSASGDEVRRRWRGLVTLVALLLVSAFASTRTGLPRPVPANAPDSAFSSSRAMSTLVEMVRRPHPTGSPEHAWVRDFIVAEMSELGMDAEIQTTTSLLQFGELARAATVRNIVARIPGSAPTGGVLITAHYDSRQIAPGAGDAASGVVTALEAIRAIRTGPPLQNDLIVVFTDAEELGLLGARAFVSEHALMADVDIVLSFEMRGAGGASIMFETAEQNGWVVRTMKEWDSHPFANSMSYEVYRRMPNGTDFTPFVEAGAQGLNYAAIDNAHVYHQAFDTPDNLSEATLQHHGIHALGALRYYGNADLTDVNEDNVVYFSVPGVGLVVYDASWVLPVSGLLLALLAVGVVVGRRAGARPRGMVLGFVASLFVLGSAYGLGYGLIQWLPGMHGEDGMLIGSVFHREGWYMLALGLGTLSVVTIVTGLLVRWASIVELALGALVVPAGLAVALSVVAPLSAMNLQWPTMAAAASVLTLSLLGTRRDGVVGWLTNLVLAAVVILMLQQIVELVWLALTFRLAGVIGALTGLMLLLCLPALNALHHPNRWWAPLTAAALAGGSLGMGLLGARVNADRPAPSTLVYAYEHGSGDAVWATSPGDVDRPGVTWAATAAGVSFDESRDLSAYGLPTGEVPAAVAPIFDAQPPEAWVTSDTVVSGARQVELRLRSRIGAEAIQLRMADGVVLESINGMSLDDPGAIRMAEHWGEPDGFVVLELRMPSDTPIGVHVVEHLLRPDEIVGEGRFDRPGRLAANVNRMSDRAVFRFSVAELADPRHAIVTVPAPPPGLFDDPEAPMVGDTLEAVPSDSVSAGPLVGDAPVGDSRTIDTMVVDTIRGEEHQ